VTQSFKTYLFFDTIVGALSPGLPLGAPTIISKNERILNNYELRRASTSENLQNPKIFIRT
jgi:hypothetical protein